MRRVFGNFHHEAGKGGGIKPEGLECGFDGGAKRGFHGFCGWGKGGGTDVGIGRREVARLWLEAVKYTYLLPPSRKEAFLAKACVGIPRDDDVVVERDAQQHARLRDPPGEQSVGVALIRGAGRVVVCHDDG